VIAAQEYHENDRGTWRGVADYAFGSNPPYELTMSVSGGRPEVIG